MSQHVDWGDTFKAHQDRLDKSERLADWMVEHWIFGTRRPDETERKAIVREALGTGKRASPLTWGQALEIWEERR